MKGKVKEIRKLGIRQESRKNEINAAGRQRYVLDTEREDGRDRQTVVTILDRNTCRSVTD